MTGIRKLVSHKNQKKRKPGMQNPVRDHTKIYQEYSGIYKCNYHNSKYIMA